MKRCSKALSAIFAALALTSVALPAGADTTATSSIPLLPAPHDAETPPMLYGVPGIKLTEHDRTRSAYYETTAAKSSGYCLIERDSMLRLEDSTTSADVHELWHLTEKDDTATLERTRFQIAPYLENAWVMSRDAVKLRAVGKADGVTIWAMREPNGDVFFIARGADAGRETHRETKPEDGGPSGPTTTSCTYGATRISGYTIAHGGGIAQLSGSLPPVGEGTARVVPRFSADISALKLSRDPEPMLTVRVRVTST